MKKHISTILLILILLVGLSLLLYPTVSDYWNSLHQSRAIADYNDAVSNMTVVDDQSLWIQAESYNRQLLTVLNPLQNHDQISGYNDVLAITDTGQIGYITIPSINVELPIYHGTSDGTLTKAVGHLQGSSLPVGGEGTHCVLSGHRGLPSAKLFTDLDRLNVGDTFMLYVLNEILTYEVDQILIVEPTDTDALQIQPGEDLCTLVTCTPYGINTHRLLVRGHRVENASQTTGGRVTSDAVQVEPIIVAPLLALPVLLMLLVILLVRARRNKKK